MLNILYFIFSNFAWFIILQHFRADVNLATKPNQIKRDHVNLVIVYMWICLRYVSFIED